MKIFVKKTEFSELQCAQTKSSLVSKIFKDIFGIDINDNCIKVQNQDNKLIWYKDVSIHGSPVWERFSVTEDADNIELYYLLTKLYSKLYKSEEKCNNE